MGRNRIASVIRVISLLLSAWGCKTESKYDPYRTCTLLQSCPESPYYSDKNLAFGSRCHRTKLRQKESRDTTGKTWELTEECLWKAKNCADLATCVNTGLTPEEDALCRNKPDESLCLGTRKILCDPRWEIIQSIDCADAGMICGQSDGRAYCGLDHCDPDTFEPHCDGDLKVNCFHGAIVTEDCRRSIISTRSAGNPPTIEIGVTCNQYDGSLPVCVGEGKDCVPFSGYCDETVAVACFGGKTSRIDCQSQDPPVGCLEVDDGGVLCRGDECDYFADVGCNGPIAKICENGVAVELDCREYGFSGCTSTQVDDRLIVSCTP